MAETTPVVDENTRIHTKGGERMEKTEFSGFFVHTLDQKNRVFIPAEFRSKLGTEFVVCTPPGSTDCIIIYTFEEWDRYFENLRVLCKGTTRAYAERIASSSKRCVIPDKQGRITLSADHCAKAHLEKEALIVGVGNRIEIWNPEIWDQKCAENMAEIEKIAADVQLNAEGGIIWNSSIYPYFSANRSTRLI
mgnify:CR=1 FL=1